MAHFAEIIDGVVQRVIVVHNNEEANGAQFCNDLLGGVWVQTSYNNRIRKQFAGIGYTYNSKADVFIAPQPFASWSLDSNYDWQAPTPKPDGDYYWNEDNKHGCNMTSKKINKAHRQIGDQTTKGGLLGIMIYTLSKNNVDPVLIAMITPVAASLLAWVSTKIGDPDLACLFIPDEKNGD
jgi:hypothetical protein